jgi:hypothetical protein
VLNRSALLPFWAAMANRDAAPVKTLHLGDSVTAGARAGSWAAHYANVLAKRLAASFPCISGNPVGGAWVPAFQSSGNGPVSQMTSSTGTAPSQGSFGIGASSAFIGSGTSATYTVTGTSVNIWAVQATSSRTFNVSIDGGTDSLVTVPAAGATTDGYLVNFSLGAAGSHTVKITNVSGNTNIGGLDVYNGDETKGFHPMFGGRSGWGANDYGANDLVGGVSIQQVMASASPHLVTIRHIRGSLSRYAPSP